MTGLPVVLDLRDPWARIPWNSRKDKGLRSRIHCRLEGVCVRNADRVELNTLPLQAEFASVYGPKLASKFVTVSNGFDPELRSLAEKLGQAPRSGANGEIRLCHPGTIYGHRDLRPVIGAVQRLVRLGFRVRFEQVGLVEDASGVLSYAECLGVREAVSLLGQVSHEETLQRMAVADVFLLSQPDTPIQVPAKLFEMLLFSRPIVALTMSQGATAEIVERFGLGVVVSPSDSEAIAAAVARTASGWPTNGLNDGLRRAMRAFDGRELTARLAEVLNGCEVRLS